MKNNSRILLLWYYIFEIVWNVNKLACSNLIAHTSVGIEHGVRSRGTVVHKALQVGLRNLQPTSAVRALDFRKALPSGLTQEFTCIKSLILAEFALKLCYRIS